MSEQRVETMSREAFEAMTSAFAWDGERRGLSSADRAAFERLVAADAAGAGDPPDRLGERVEAMLERARATLCEGAVTMMVPLIKAGRIAIIYRRAPFAAAAKVLDQETLEMPGAAENPRLAAAMLASKGDPVAFVYNRMSEEDKSGLAQVMPRAGRRPGGTGSAQPGSPEP